jgi:catechol 2,3-dioxygenase-like lactoylglutathione lyase family enzyme
VIRIDRLDHLVLTVASVEATCTFYVRTLGMTVVRFGVGRTALAFGAQKINLHQAGSEFVPHATHPVPGSADLCLITMTPLADAMAHVRVQGLDILEGPVARTGATGPMQSFYFRDPDGNLIEVSNYVAA